MYSGGLSKDGDLRKVCGWELEGEHRLEANFERVRVFKLDAKSESEILMQNRSMS